MSITDPDAVDCPNSNCDGGYDLSTYDDAAETGGHCDTCHGHGAI